MEYRWYVELTGHVIDLSEMQARLRTGPSRIIENDGKWYIGSDEFQSETAEDSVCRIASDVISRLNSAFRAALGRFDGVALGSSVMEIAPDGPRITYRVTFSSHMDFHANVRDSVGEPLINGVPAPPVRSLAEMIVDQASRSIDFYAALRAFNAEPPTFADLYIAMETIKKVHDPSPNENPKGRTERGGKAIAERGWASTEELLDFNATANYYRHGHPREPIGRTKMSLDNAVNLVRRLLHRWAENA